MNKLWITLLVAVFFACNQQTEKKIRTIKIKGSESMLSTFEALKWDFEQSQDSVKIQIEGGGSRTGLMAVGDGGADIGMSSYDFNLDSVFPDRPIASHRVAFDGIVVITNENNPVHNLTNEQMRDVYTGRITNWSELGGADGEIVPIIRDENSGTQRFFSGYFKIDSISSKAIVKDHNDEISDKVASDVNAIGFMGYGYFNDMVNPCGLEFTDEYGQLTFLPPNRVHLESGDYPLKRGLFIYYNSSSRRNDIFMNYLQTKAAKNIISNHGLIVSDSAS